MRRIFAIVVWVVFAVVGTLPAQHQYFAHYGLDDGLPHSRVNAILQDKQGFIWLATNMGVSRFDGHQFQNFAVKDGIGDNKVTAMLELENGQIITGHDNGSLSIYDGNHFENYPLEIHTGAISCLVSDKQGYLWVGTQETGVYRLVLKDLVKQIKEKKFVHFNEKQGLARSVFSMFCDQSGKLWLITDLGLKTWDEDTKQFSYFYPKGIDYAQYSCISEDRKGALWLGTWGSGIYRYQPKTHELVNYSVETGKLKSNLISFFQRDKQGRILAGTWGGGLVRFEGEEVELLSEENGLSENRLRCAQEDREGNLWLGTNQQGVSILRNRQFRAFLHAQNGDKVQVGAMLRDSRGRYWFGSNNSIYLRETATSEIRKIDFLMGSEDIEVTSLAEDGSGRIWIGTWGGGILMIGPQSYELERFQGKIPFSDPATFTEQYVHTLKRDSRGRMWISMLRGVSVFDAARNTLKTYTQKDGLAQLSTTDIEEDADGAIWVGTQGGGLARLKNDRFEMFNKGVHRAVSSLARDTKGNLWIGTEGGGLSVWDGQKFRSYSITDGLPSNYLTSVEVDETGRIWLGTNKGLFVYDVAKKSGILFDKSDNTSRIESRPNAVYREKTGAIWVGTINGVFKFQPSEIHANPVESITTITAVKVFQDTVNTENLKLNFKRNYLSFHFNGMCFSDPEKVRYRYMLEGFDKTWQETELNVVTYTSLSPGNYTFKVMSSNNDGLWNAKPVEVKFEITPPYWMTWWFYTICSVLIVAGIRMFIIFRERNLRLEKRKLEEQVNERTAEIVSQKEEIERQRDEISENSKLIELKNQSITDSILYARRIQLATLPYRDDIQKSLPDSFVFYKPKDIVSGDFYAFAVKEGKILIAVADCTGHGVPGAFMSMIGTNLFNQVINEKGIVRPSEILNELNHGIERALKQEESDNHDGMDISVCCLDFAQNTFEYAGANRPLWILRTKTAVESGIQGEFYGEYLQMIRPDKQPIGGFSGTQKASFTNHFFTFEPGDTMYLFTDGLADQFGGTMGKKLLSKRVRDFILEIKHQPIAAQERLLEQFFESWRGSYEQVDDVLMIGVRYPA